MAGYDENVLDHVIKTARGSRNNIILFDGRDVALMFDGTVGLIDALTAKIDAAEQEGLMWRPLSSLSPLTAYSAAVVRWFPAAWPAWPHQHGQPCCRIQPID